MWLPRARLKSEVSGSATRNAFVPQPPESFTYDSDGNLTSDGRWDYTWDAENRLVSLQTRPAALGYLPNAEARRLEFTYDYLGRRVRKRTDPKGSGLNICGCRARGSRAR